MAVSATVGIAAATLIGAGVGAAAAAPAAGTSPVVVTDRAGDGHGPGDFRGLRIWRPTWSNVVMMMQVRTAQPLDLAASRAFRSPTSSSQLRFNVDTDGDQGTEVVILLEPSPSGPRVVFKRPGGFAGASPEGVCASMQQPSLDLIRLTIHRSCLDPVLQVTEVRGSARYRLDRGGNGTIDSDDRVPRAFSPTYHLED